MKKSKKLHDRAMEYADASDAAGGRHYTYGQLAYLLLAYSSELEAHYACDKKRSRRVLLESSMELLRGCVALAKEEVGE